MAYDIPIVHDELQQCEHCNVICQHHIVDYVDASYRTCTRCGMKTTLVPVKKILKLTSETIPDRRLEDDYKRDTDFKLGRKKKNIHKPKFIKAIVACPHGWLDWDECPVCGH